MDIFLDTSFVIPLIIETETTAAARSFFTTASGASAASMSVYEESFFVGLRLCAESEYGISTTAHLKEHIRKNGYGFADEFIRDLNVVFSGITIVADSHDLNLIGEVARMYALLPNDALIVATCREQRIKRIATFDRDFSRVKELERVAL
jgi:predicted nucleic acid-binding protein